jgi:3-methyl-2-oxobutanoate hydroxymethyltransferase
MPVTTRDIRAKKSSVEKLVMVTAYDAPTARIVDEAGVDVILVGDSVGTNVLGLDSEARVTMDDMVHHARAVARSAANALLVGDLPFMTYRVSTEQALATSARMIQDGHMHAVKLEGGAEMAGRVKAITSAGIPVMGHVGLTPQSANELGGYRAQGKDSKGARSIVDGAVALENAGAFAIVLESVPYRLAELITNRVGVPTIGIGAGPGCDGQVQVINDIAGWNPDFLPKHSRRFGNVDAELRKAVTGYVEEVRKGTFPTERHSFRIKDGVIEELND